MESTRPIVALAYLGASQELAGRRSCHPMTSTQPSASYRRACPERSRGLPLIAQVFVQLLCPVREHRRVRQDRLQAVHGPFDDIHARASTSGLHSRNQVRGTCADRVTATVEGPRTLARVHGASLSFLDAAPYGALFTTSGRYMSHGPI
jgi:hypothetical protein